jgi:hypothetical protein
MGRVGSGLPTDLSTEARSAKVEARRREISERVWRVRKNHSSIDAQLSDRDGGVEIRYFYDGEPILSQEWRTRELALTDAAERLRDLQRAGWTTHW